MSQVSQQRLDAQFTWEDTAQVQAGLRLLTKVLEARLAELEGQRADYAGVIEELTGVALQRINEVLLPTLPVLDEIIRLGFGSERIIDSGSFGRSVLQTKTEGDFATLAGIDDLVAAQAAAAATQAGTAQNLATTAATVSSLLQRLDTIQGGANNALDTFAEIAARFAQEDSSTAAVLDAIAKRLRFDAAQTLNSTQRTQALGNLGVTAIGRDLLAAVDQAAMRAVINAQQGLGFSPVQEGGVEGLASDYHKIKIGWGAVGGLGAQVDAVGLGALWTDWGCPYTLNGAFWQQKFPNGMIQMGGLADSAEPDFRLVFPNAFPNECKFVGLTNTYSPAAYEMVASHASGVTRFGADIRRRAMSGAGVATFGGPTYWHAIGR